MGPCKVSFEKLSAQAEKIWMGVWGTEKDWQWETEDKKETAERVTQVSGIAL